MKISGKTLTILIVCPLAITAGCIFLIKVVFGNMDTRQESLEVSITGLESEVQEMKALLTDLIAKVEDLGGSSVSKMEGQAVASPAQDNWLSFYSRNVSAMNAFLENNPQLLIPEMSLLEGDELLAAMKGLSFDCQADFNKAAARLRLAAKMKIGRELSEALKTALSQSEGELPDMDQLARHLQTSAARDALERYTLTTDNQLYDGMRFSGGDELVLVEKPKYVDDTWFSQMIVNNAGGMGMQSSYEHMDDQLREKISQFEDEHGRAATSLDDLIPYLDESDQGEKDLTRLSVIFDELHLPPEP